MDGWTDTALNRDARHIQKDYDQWEINFYTDKLTNISLIMFNLITEKIGKLKPAEIWFYTYI